MCDRLQVPITPQSQTHSTRRPIAIDLFSGAGGLSLGFEQAGFDVVAAVEYDAVHAATHLYNFPECEILCRDASRLSADDLLQAAERGFRRANPRARWHGRVDAIVGGPPCQGFSAGGKRLANDERNDLLLQFVRLVTEVQPRVFCLENVAGLLEVKFEPVLKTALAELRAAGYEVSGTDTPVNSIDFGVPQRRKRAIILGSREGVIPPRPIPIQGKLSVAEALQGLPPLLDYPELLDSDEVELRSVDQEYRGGITAPYARQLAGFDSIPGDRSRPRVWDPILLTNSRRTIHGEATVRRFEMTRPGSVEPKSRLYRLPNEGPSRTLRAGTGSERGSHTSPRPIHPSVNRVITVREAARLHGYPDWFRFHTTNWHGHRQVGNSVPPPLARAAAQVLMQLLGNRPGLLRSARKLGDPSLLRMNMATAKLVVNAVDDELPATRTRTLKQAE
ncbi:DNA cytosine methyltransferase [Rhodococcus oxybenzonivorans]|uniref:DNA cytosine methyltransferase n=1 Tax=Rhodococcus TaxID=1827 RepID=UPI0037CB1623